MRNQSNHPLFTVWFWLTCLFLPCLARGTDMHEYRPGETLVINAGLAPDRRLAVAAGPLNEIGDGRFGLFLVDIPSKHRIGRLEEFKDALDSGAESIHAAWAPDSRHVVITYRVDRSVTATLVYRVEHRRAYPVTGPLDLLAAVKGAGAVDTSRGTTFTLYPTWLTASRFTLRQHSHYHHLNRNPKPILGGYVEVWDEQGKEVKGAGAKGPYSFDFYADGVCELLAGDRHRLRAVKPVAPKDR